MSTPATEIPADTCCPVLELRQYTLHPGQRDVLIELFDREFVESQEAHGIRLIGEFRDLGNPDRFVWLRGFPDMPARAAALAAFYGGPIWKAHRDAANATMVDSDNVLLLRPARADSGFAVDHRPPPPHDATSIPPSLVEARSYYLEADASDGLVDDLTASVTPILREAGARLLATLVTEPAQNNFPRLPIREGEHVFIWFAQFPDRVAYDRYLDTLSASVRWREADAILSRHAARTPETLLLAPTARSRLPH